ncbi:MAG TPA: glycosyltransferase family 39 protein [Candidatus Paceibacterota bacterium]|nr:glycosyltransferase family 39 protein [Candidatus Paceibacterota bacterium]
MIKLSYIKLILTHYIVLTIISLVLLGGILRFWHLGEASYWMDEGYTVNAVLSIQETGSSVLDSSQKYSCPIYCYPTSWIADFFGNSPGSYRALAAVSGSLFIIVIFFIVRKFFGSTLSLVSTFLITFSYWQIAWSRQARWYTLFTLFFWLSLYFFYRALRDNKQRWRHMLLSLLFSLLTIFTHKLGYILPCIFLIWYVIDRYLDNKPFSLKIVTLLILAGVLVLSLVTYHSGLVFDINWHYTLPYYLNFYLRTYWLFIAFGVFGFFSLYTKYKREYLFLLTVFLSYLIPLSFLTNIVHYRYLFHVTPVIIILATLGIYALYTETKSTLGKKSVALIFLILFFTVGGGVLIPGTDYPLESDNPQTLGDRPHYAYTPQPNWTSAYTTIKEQLTESHIVISSHPHFNKIYLNEPGFWIKYNYLGFDNQNEYVNNDYEFYVNAIVIDDLLELERITNTYDGFLIFDYMAADNRLNADILDYITNTFELIHHEASSPFSQVWVYRF